MCPQGLGGYYLCEGGFRPGPVPEVADKAVCRGLIRRRGLQGAASDLPYGGMIPTTPS